MARGEFKAWFEVEVRRLQCHVRSRKYDALQVMSGMEWDGGVSMQSIVGSAISSHGRLHEHIDVPALLRVSQLPSTKDVKQLNPKIFTSETIRSSASFPKRNVFHHVFILRTAPIRMNQSLSPCS